MLSILRTCHLLVFCKVFQMFASFCSVFVWVGFLSFIFYIKHMICFYSSPFLSFQNSSCLHLLSLNSLRLNLLPFIAAVVAAQVFLLLRTTLMLSPPKRLTSNVVILPLSLPWVSSKLDPAVSNCKCLLDPEDFSPCLLLTLLLPSVLLLLD